MYMSPTPDPNIGIGNVDEELCCVLSGRSPIYRR